MGAVSRRCVGSAARRQASADPAVPRPVQHDVLLGVTTPSPQPSSRAPHTSAAAPSSAACCPPALLQSSPVSADLPHLLKPAKPLELNSAASTGGLAVSGGSPATSGPVLRRRRSLPACLRCLQPGFVVWQAGVSRCYSREYLLLVASMNLSPDREVRGFASGLACCLPLSPPRRLGPPLACGTHRRRDLFLRLTVDFSGWADVLLN